MPGDEPRRTPLAAEHEALGAKMGAFGGWRMPIEYAGAVSEHAAVRQRVGLFDLSHLGKVDVTGAGALGMLQRTLSNDLERLGVGDAQYNLMLDDRGGVIEDLIVYRLEAERYFVVPNAANTDRVLGILSAAAGEGRVRHHADWCFLAVQGPDSITVTSALFPEAAELRFMHGVTSAYRGEPVVLARTGYTGEVGFELFTTGGHARELWRELSEAMAPHGGAPCGLAARDVLRLEMGYPLWGQDLLESATALEAGLSWAVAMDKGDFTGREALARQRTEGLPSRLRGLRMRERRYIPRSHQAVLRNGEVVGKVTSGTYSPLLRMGIALAYLRPGNAAAVGDAVQVDVRGRVGDADVVQTPFVDRSPR